MITATIFEWVAMLREYRGFIGDYDSAMRLINYMDEFEPQMELVIKITKDNKFFIHQL